MYIYETAIIPDNRSRGKLIAWLRRNNIPYETNGIRVEARLTCCRRFADKVIAKFAETGSDCIGTFRIGDRLEVYHDSC